MSKQALSTSNKVHTSPHVWFPLTIEFGPGTAVLITGPVKPPSRMLRSNVMYNKN